MALEPLTWEHTCEAIATLYGTDAQTIANTLTANGVAVGDVEQAFKMLEGTSYEIFYNADGSVRSYNYVGTPQISGGASQVIDSNVQTATKTAVKIPLNTAPSVADSTKVTFGAGMKQAGNFVVKSVVPAIAATSWGITLGKKFDSALYNANPDFWDSHGWGSLNPETWGTITQDDVSLGSTAFNFVYKIDASTKTSQAYMDQTAAAYLTKILYDKGIFATGTEGASYDLPDNLKSIIDMPIALTDVENIVITRNAPYNPTRTITFSSNNDVKVAQMDYAGLRLLFASSEPNTVVQAYYDGSADNTYSLRYSYTYDNKTVYYNDTYAPGRYDTISPNYENTCSSGGDPSVSAWVMIYGTMSGGAVIDGIGTQDGATTPSIDPNDDIATILQKLQTQYPDLFNNAVTQDVIQPDGSVKTYTYIPVGQAQPNPNPTDGYDPQDQPISSTSTQANPEVDPETATEAQLQYLIGLLTDLVNPNLENTGEGNTPAVIIPTGSASALYTVYNPTESEIHSFGGWLWSSNFVDQLLKMFNDPMQAIISLHKVFCTPSVSGRNNIKVGYLDSGVAANVVNAQYVTIDCGSVNLSEEFQNVFDYIPFTDVNLYLPFIGFVRLDTNDVMRGSINVVYHVDVLTGACLAEVNVTRDMFGGVIYQYTGDCSVHYPLSSGSYMGMVSALLGVAGTIVSGGSLAPMVIGASAKALSGRSSVERSGNLSGNAGAMGIKKPYLVIQRPQTNLANVFETFVGKPANYTTKISDCTGFISCTEVHIENCNGTDSELAELENLLKTGIII